MSGCLLCLIVSCFLSLMIPKGRLRMEHTTEGKLHMSVKEVNSIYFLQTSMVHVLETIYKLLPSSSSRVAFPASSANHQPFPYFLILSKHPRFFHLPISQSNSSRPFRPLESLYHKARVFCKTTSTFPFFVAATSKKMTRFIFSCF